MRVYRCKCGAREFYGSGMLPNPCEPCPKCGVVPGGTDPIPHEFVAERVETDHGDDVLSRCRFCLKTKRELTRTVDTTAIIAAVMAAAPGPDEVT